MLQPVSDSQLEEWAAEISSINVSRWFLLGNFGLRVMMMTLTMITGRPLFIGVPSAYLFLMQKHAETVFFLWML